MDGVIPIKPNTDLCVSFCDNRKSKRYKNKKVSWLDFLKISHENTVKTNETYDRYIKMSKDDQYEFKDVGGFVGGFLREGRRTNRYVENRQLVTLDFDYAYDLWGELMGNLDLDYAMAIYSTHKHSKNTPRYRFLMPFQSR